MDPEAESFYGLSPYNSMGNNPVTNIDPEGDFFAMSNIAYEALKRISPVAIKFNLGIFKGQFGVEVSIGVPKTLPISGRLHFGIDYYSGSHDGMVSGWQTTNGKEVSFLSGGITLTSTQYHSKDENGNSTSQTTGMLTVGNEFYNLKVQNDFWPKEVRKFAAEFGLEMGDSEDRWRTGAGQVNFLGVGVGVNIGTGSPLDNDGFKPTYFLNGNETYSTSNGSSPNRYRVGNFYLRIGSIRLGKRSDKWRAKVQNEWIHDNMDNAHHFQRQYSGAEGFYFHWGNGTGSGLW